jgi:hypothetical protein
MSTSTSEDVEMDPEGYLRPHPIDQKKRIVPFSIRSIILLVEEIEN